MLAVEDIFLAWYKLLYATAKGVSFSETVTCFAHDSINRLFFCYIDTSERCRRKLSVYVSFGTCWSSCARTCLFHLCAQPVL